MFRDFKVKVPSDSAGVLEKTRELHVSIMYMNITRVRKKGIRFLKVHPLVSVLMTMAR